VNRRRSFFLSVEGGEGVGKSTFVTGLAKMLGSGGQTVVSTFEPGGTSVADQIRGLFTNPPEGETLDRRTELLLVCASRAQHVERVIKPALNSEKIVICDRFSDSTRVYQGALAKNDLQKMEEIIAFAEGGCNPQLTFLLDAPVDVLADRLEKRGGEQSRFDRAGKEVHELIRKSFLNVADDFPDRIVLLNAAEPPEKLVQKAFDLIQKKMELGQ
jgi:dTMP kinase